MEKKLFSPRETLKTRRPERFSDSVIEDIPVLDRSILEYHLDSLTSRSQETDFEHFARHLAQRELCPNLLPQTGPTGGGDSKVDAETYPVADALSLVWHVGVGREASEERWAFAFSAKKVWLSKVRSDIKKIASTNRGYSKAFFITNQYVRDKKRAEVEDELGKEHGLDVRILDRTWILDKVFSNKRELLAIEDLRIQTFIREHVRKGPLDLQREQDLEKVEARIQSASQRDNPGLQFVADCIEAATLARGLERPRTEVDGHFERAVRVAEKHGTGHQRLLCAYEKALTSFWWFEDYELFLRLYGEAETHAKGSRNAHDLELLTNLWIILHTHVTHGITSEVDADLKTRTETLTAELARLSKEENRPSSVLQARTLHLLIQLLECWPDDAEPIFGELQNVVCECEDLVGYPLEPLAGALVELGEAFSDSVGYEGLLAVIVDVTSSRKGDVAGARILLKRGAQQLTADRPYEAIRFIGRALRLLFKDESREDLVNALYLCGSAYERVGLLWAARGTLLAAASLAIDEFWTYSNINAQQAACLNRLKWLELKLGRVPHLLNWHEMDRTVTATLMDRGEGPEWLGYDEFDFDGVLGLLLLRTEVWQMELLSGLPDVLSGLGLNIANDALLFALGHGGEMPDEFAEGGKATLSAFYMAIRDQPANDELPEMPVLYEGQEVVLSSQCLGCQITVSCEKILPCVELAESILAGLESLLSTGMVDNIIAREPVLMIVVRRSDTTEKPFEFDVESLDGRPSLQIRCREFDPHSMSHDFQSEIKDELVYLLATILANVFVLSDDPERSIEKLFREDLALQRSINFTSSFAVVGNLLGNEPRDNISAWLRTDVRKYEPKRAVKWDATERAQNSAPTANENHSAPTYGKGDPPEGLLDLSAIKHTQMTTISLIRVALWDQAGWSGTAFSWPLDGSEMPIFALLFKDGEAAQEIFTQWIEELGESDDEELLRVSIIRGISRENPHAYRIVIGSNTAAVLAQKVNTYVRVINRIQTMEPSSDNNLSAFLDRFGLTGEYHLGYAVLTGESPQEFHVAESVIAKRELNIRQAWEIGPHDMEVVGILVGDDPIIPEDQENAPVLDLLRRLEGR